MTVIYFENGAEVIEPKTDAHEADWERWLPGAKVGEVIDTPLNPVIYRT